MKNISTIILKSTSTGKPCTCNSSSLNQSKFVYLAFDVLTKLRYINMRHRTKVHKIFKCTIGLKHTECVVICTHDKEVTGMPLTAVALTYAR